MDKTVKYNQYRLAEEHFGTIPLSYPASAGLFFKDKTMKHIPLTQGKFTIVDDEDFEWLNKYKWCAHFESNMCYAYTNIRINGKHRILKMHRMIVGARHGELTDHRNTNGLDNRSENLRICTKAQNSMNRPKQKGNYTSKYKGVSWSKIMSKWLSSICFNRKFIKIDYYEDEIEAAKAYNKKALELFGEFAYLNVIE